MRKAGKLAVALVSDKQLRELFDAVDVDRGGTIDVEELTEFLMKKPGEGPVVDTSAITVPDIVDQSVHDSNEAVKAQLEALQQGKQALDRASSAKHDAHEAHNTTVKAREEAEAAQSAAVSDAQQALDVAKGKAKQEAEENLESVRTTHNEAVSQARAQEAETHGVLDVACTRCNELEAEASKTEQLLQQLQGKRDVLTKEEISSRYQDALEKYFQGENDRQVHRTLMEVEKLNGGPYDGSTALLQKLRSKTSRAPLARRDPTWLPNTLKRIYTSNANREHQTCVRATARHNGELQQALESGKQLSSKTGELESQVQLAEGALAKVEADAQTAIDAAGKKEKESITAEWETKIEEARESLEKQRKLLATVARQQQATNAKVNRSQKLVDKSHEQEQDKLAEAETAKAAAAKKWSDIEKKRQQEKALRLQTQMAQKPCVRPQTAQRRPVAKTSLSLPESNRAQRPRSAFQRQISSPPPTVDFFNAMMINEQVNANVTYMRDVIEGSQIRSPSASMRPRSAVTRMKTVATPASQGQRRAYMGSSSKARPQSAHPLRR